MTRDTRWKAVTLDYAALSNYDDAIQLSVCLTQRQVAILKALLTTAYWVTRWTNLSISSDVLDSQIANLDNQLDGNDCEVSSMDFRNNPSDPCEVQYSNDGGETWATMFRLDICSTGSVTSDLTIIEGNKTEIENNFTLWDNDIINVAPEWEYVDSTSDKAICWAIDMYVDAIADIAIAELEAINQARRDNNEFWNTIRDIITTAAVAASVTIGLPAVAAGAVAWAALDIADIWWDGLQGRDTSDFEDADARAAIKCAMYNDVKGDTVQWPDWRDSLSDYNPLPSELALWEQVSVWNGDVNVYINYMLLVEDINSIKGSLPACDCPAGTWLHEWDFENYGPDVWIISPTGSFVPDSGFVGAVIEGDETHEQMLLFELQFPEYVPRVNRLNFYFDCVKGEFTTNKDAVWVKMLPELDITQNQGAVFTGIDQMKNWSFDYNNAVGCDIGFRTSWTDTADYGSILIKRVIFQGIGDDPFEGRVTAARHEP